MIILFSIGRLKILQLLILITLALSFQMISAQPPAPAPNPPPRIDQDVVSIFSEAYSNVIVSDFNPNWGQTGTVDIIEEDGNKLLHYSNFNYQGTQLKGSYNISAMKFLHLDVWTSDTVKIKVSPVNISGAPREQLIKLTPIIPNAWNSYDIPVSSFTRKGMKVNYIFQIKIDGQSGSNPSNIYLDNIYFYKPEASPTDASLVDFRVNGEPVKGFSPAVIEYNIDLIDGTKNVPTLSAVSNSAHAKIEMTPAANIPGTSTVLVTAANGISTRTYSVKFTIDSTTSDYELVWGDEFNGKGVLNDKNWHHQVQLPEDGGWFNGELQHYTNRFENSFVADGHLNIVARKENFTDQGVTKDYTSARLNSKYSFIYGRVDVRAKLPGGAGTWPAIWMLGRNVNEPGGYWFDDYGSVNWPKTGEIDIMEHWGNNPGFVHGSIHTRSSFGGTVNTGTKELSDVLDSFHIYSIIWDEEKILFLVDNEVFYTYSPEIKDGKTWPFDKPQYLLLNVALGGIGGTIDPEFQESTMEIDYVRIYQKKSAVSH